MILVATVVANLFVAAVLIATPALSRAETPLGVRVPADRVDDPAVRAAVRAYRRATAVIAGAVVLVGGVVALALDTQRAAVVGLGLLPLVLIGLALLAMARSRRAILNARQAEGWMQGASPGEMDDEHLYRWGLFYVNPDDSSLLVEKRFGYGSMSTTAIQSGGQSGGCWRCSSAGQSSFWSGWRSRRDDGRIRDGSGRGMARAQALAAQVCQGDAGDRGFYVASRDGCPATEGRACRDICRPGVGDGQFSNFSGSSAASRP